MLHNNIQYVRANYTNSGLYDAVKYFIDDVVKEFTNECFIKCIFFGGNSVYSKFYDEDSANSDGTLPKSNSNNTCISNNINHVESAVSLNAVTIHPNSIFDNITDANITAINAERVKLIIAKSPFSTTL